ncbi:MAG: hypothetical protein AB7T49_17945 [Oligoflexales bacterium]
MLRLTLITLVLFFDSFASAHTVMCDHTHNPDGTITWHCHDE